MSEPAKRSNDERTLTAYEVTEHPMTLAAPARSRAWMDATPNRFAYRCLPLVIANQIGWDVLCPVAFTATWDGTDSPNGITIDFAGEVSDMVHAHFGGGVLTFSIGYLFRTPPGHNMWVRGPVNEPRDGIAPLEGVVETDWAPFTFTMNWKFTREHHTVAFAPDEVVCRLLPYPREYVNDFDPVLRSIYDDPALCREYLEWVESRNRLNEGLRTRDPAALEQGWQRDYMQGRTQRGDRFEAHQTRIEQPMFRKSA
ncbi:MAG: DUF6065 family protein [Planctomycetota bacterium]